MVAKITSTLRPGYFPRNMQVVVRKVPCRRRYELRLSDGALSIPLALDGACVDEFKTKRAAIHHAVSNGLDFVTQYHIEPRQ